MLKTPPNQRQGGNGRLAIIAGRGRLPLDVAEAIRASGNAPFIIALEGQAENISDAFDHQFIGLGDGAALQRLITEHRIDRVILSGGVDRRPTLKDLRVPFRLLPVVPGILRRLLGSGDDRLLRAVIALIERAGCKVIGAQEIVPDLLAESGVLTKRRPSAADSRDIGSAYDGADRLGRLDIGQGAVAIGGRIVALEGPEGTDNMLRRVAEMRRSQRITSRPGGVLVKLCKTQQDERADLPSIGPETVRRANEAGLSGIAVEAGRAFILDRQAAVAEANSRAMFLIGIERKNLDRKPKEQRQDNV